MKFNMAARLPNLYLAAFCRRFFNQFSFFSSSNLAALSTANTRTRVENARATYSTHSDPFVSTFHALDFSIAIGSPVGFSGAKYDNY
jgi:hypothetical protein